MKFKKVNCKTCNGSGKVNSLIYLKKELDNKLNNKKWDNQLYNSDVNEILDWLFKELNKLSQTKGKVKK